MFEKTFDPNAREGALYALWEEAEVFSSQDGKGKGKPFSIVIPPPNVTGTLHMGHALNTTLQDVLVRFARMQGRDVLWQPGTDHAGIATQMVVERTLAEEGKTRQDLGREDFLKRVWEWKGQSGGKILEQLRRLGASCDWSRERFTMDEGLSEAVREVFVRLYKEGLIYRDQRLVNWDPKFCTALSDLEVYSTEIEGSLWFIRYAVPDGNDEIVIATTRPETLLADTAIAVSPEDERYRHLIGKHAIVPLVGRHIPIIADEYCDPEMGTGALKVTPAHDFNDFTLGRRHALATISIFDVHARVTLKENIAFLEGVARTEDLVSLMDHLEGQDRFDARKWMISRLEETGALFKTERHVHMVPHGDRSHVVVEPLLTDQWYVNAKALAQPAIASVASGEVSFFPQSWEKTYFEWMNNIEPWCISRQLWWGHPIPAWYGPDGTIFVEKTEQLAQEAATAHYGKDVSLTQDPDVLDTWFSSALWPFSTLGWPEETPELARYYPTTILVTAFDIIFFWVARMMMMGIHFTGQAPFKTVLIHALVRDEKGQKMSKSKGNVKDPLELIERYGADALRLTLCALATPGRDVHFSQSRIEGYRNFTTKLWNAARFCEINQCIASQPRDPLAARLKLNRWILDQLSLTIREVTKALEEYRMHDAARMSYHFVWDVFCDWYLELIKPLLQGEDGVEKQETRHMAGFVLQRIVRLLHPFVPFITEEIWQKISEKTEEASPLLAYQPWPSLSSFEDLEAREETNWIIGLITEIRSVRAEIHVPPAVKVPCFLVGASPERRRIADDWRTEILRLARLERLVFNDHVPEQTIQIVYGESVIALSLSGVLDIATECARLEKERIEIETEMETLSQRLSVPGFVDKAPPAIVEATRERHKALNLQKQKVSAALERLKRGG